MEWEEFLAGITEPARRALASAGIGSLEELARRSEAELLALHGLGPKSLGPIRAALEASGYGSVRVPGEPPEDSGKAAVDAFLEGFTPPVRRLLGELRAVIRENAPGASEKIAYGIPTFVLKGNLVHFSGYERHIGFYPGAEGIESFEAELSGYKHAKGSVQFPIDRPLPLDLIARIVRFRVERNLSKKKR